MASPLGTSGEWTAVSYTCPQRLAPDLGQKTTEHEHVLPV